MTREEAIRELKADYCGNRIICELYPDQCNREDCEIWLAIKALETQPDGDAVSRKDAIRIVDSIDTWQAGWRGDAIESLKALPSAQPEVAKDTNVPNNDCISRQAAISECFNVWKVCDDTREIDEFAKLMVDALQKLPSAQPESTRTFVELVVEYPDPELCTYKEYKGKPYYSIKYIENGETYVGYGTYNPEVMSQYLKEYFISSAQHEITPDGTLKVSIDADVASVGRILLSQAGTQRGGLYYKDAQPEETCDTCKYGYFGDGKCDNCRVGYPSHYERRTDVKADKGTSR